MATPSLDLDRVRGFFPALGDDWALFDNAGGSVVADPVRKRVARYLRDYGVQHGASYRLSQEATELCDEGRAAAAVLLGEVDPDEVVLGPSTTMNVYVLAQALRPTWNAGDAVVVTNLDHEANIGAWRRLESTGIELREWKLDPETAALRLEDLEPLLDERVRLVCFSHCSNVVGLVHDVAAITALAHRFGAQVCVDGVAYAPHRPLKVREWDVDWYLFSAYKVYGPHLGILYGKRERLLAAKNQNHFFYEESQVPHKLMPGNVSHELAPGLTGIVHYLHEVGDGDLDLAYRRIAAHEADLVERFGAFLRSRDDIEWLGSASGLERLPTFAFTVRGRKSNEIPPPLDAQQVAIRWGDFYAARAIDALGLRERHGVIRASAVHYNTLEEVDRLIAALERVL